MSRTTSERLRDACNNVIGDTKHLITPDGHASLELRAACREACERLDSLHQCKRDLIDQQVLNKELHREIRTVEDAARECGWEPFTESGTEKLADFIRRRDRELSQDRLRHELLLAGAHSERDRLREDLEALSEKHQALEKHFNSLVSTGSWRWGDEWWEMMEFWRTKGYSQGVAEARSKGYQEGVRDNEKETERFLCEKRDILRGLHNDICELLEEKRQRHEEHENGE